MNCEDCGREIYYEGNQGDYHHLNPVRLDMQEQPCFLIPEALVYDEEQDLLVMVRGEWKKVPDA